MTTSDIISGIALVVAGLALFQSRSATTKAQETADSQLRLSQGQIETTIENQLLSCRTSQGDFLTEHGDFLDQDPEKLGPDELRRRERLKKKAESLAEGYLSALNSACQKYWDVKVDTERFRLAYQREIRQVFENEGYKPLLSGRNPYHALCKFYDKYESSEKPDPPLLKSLHSSRSLSIAARHLREASPFRHPASQASWQKSVVTVVGRY